MQMTSIIIPNFNGMKWLEPCISSIERHTAQPYEIIVVDNGSKDGSTDFCVKKGIRLVSLPFNRGFPAACNLGLKIASGDAILLLNNDVLVIEHWLDNMLRCLYSSEDIGIVGPMSNYVSGKQQVQEPYTNLKDVSQKFSSPDPAKWVEVQRLVGFCFLFKREVLNKVGLLDELFTPGHFEHDDYCYRARLQGFRLMVAGDSFIFHHGSSSFNRQSNDAINALLETNLNKFMNKWGFDPRTLI